MVCMGFDPGTARWYAQTNPLSYGGPQKRLFIIHKIDVCLNFHWMTTRLCISKCFFSVKHSYEMLKFDNYIGSRY